MSDRSTVIIFSAGLTAKSGRARARLLRRSTRTSCAGTCQALRRTLRLAGRGSRASNISVRPMIGFVWAWFTFGSELRVQLAGDLQGQFPFEQSIIKSLPSPGWEDWKHSIKSTWNRPPCGLEQSILATLTDNGCDRAAQAGRNSKMNALSLMPSAKKCSVRMLLSRKPETQKATDMT